MADLCPECMGEILTIEERDMMWARFEEAHKAGAERFGVDWLKANEMAISAAHELNIEPSKRKIQALLSLACLNILIEFEKRWKLKASLLALLVLMLSVASASAQERPARTWATVGATLTKSTARESGPVIVGLEVQLAYDLRHNFQAIGEGEYRSGPVIRRLFTGRFPDRAGSEIRYGGKLIRHFGPVFVGAGVSVIRHTFSTPRPSPYQDLYDSSVNPTISAGAQIGKRSQIVFTKYLADTYSYSNLRGLGVDFANTRRVSERVRLRSGVRFKHWSFYEGQGYYDKRAIEVGGFVGFQFQ